MRHSRSSSARRALLLALAAAAVGCGSASSDMSASAASDLSQSQCATAKPWAPNTVYKVGDVVSFQGIIYVVLQAHTSLFVWPPNIVPALFQPTNCSSPPA